ncbi:hypothetical protein V6R21_07390 [Limibacter armeniacum]|uniref:hypothetical protein n=1 Tax=Limibacter armeniacum TaxID=466084 RepID=UPI002FE59DEA
MKLKIFSCTLLIFICMVSSLAFSQIEPMIQLEQDERFQRTRVDGKLLYRLKEIPEDRSFVSYFIHVNKGNAELGIEFQYLGDVHHNLVDVQLMLGGSRTPIKLSADMPELFGFEYCNDTLMADLNDKHREVVRGYGLNASSFLPYWKEIQLWYQDYQVDPSSMQNNKVRFTFEVGGKGKPLEVTRNLSEGEMEQMETVIVKFAELKDSYNSKSVEGESYQVNW